MALLSTAPPYSNSPFISPHSPPSFRYSLTIRKKQAPKFVARALREWKEYEQAVKDKDLAKALRFLKSMNDSAVQSHSLDNSTQPPPSPLPRGAELGLFGLGRDWEVLDTCLNADDMRLVSSAYSFLKDRGLLPNFGKCRNIVIEGPRDITPSVLQSSTGLEVSKLSPKKWGLYGASSTVLFAFIGGVSFLLSQGIDIRPNLAVILGLAFFDSIVLGGSCLAQISSYWPPYRKRILVHEAGHLLTAYLMGCPIRGVILDPIVAMQMGIQGQSNPIPMAKTRHTGPPNPPPSPPSQNQTQNQTQNPTQIDISQQLATIASRLEQLDGLALKVASLESRTHSNNQMAYQEVLAETSHRGELRGNQRQSAPPAGRTRPPWWDDPPAEDEVWRGFPQQRRHRAKIDFPKFDGGDPRGWILKAEKYFRYFEVAEESKVEVAAMHLEGDALDLYAWVNGEGEILAWADLIQVFQESYGPPEFQNPDEFLCAIRQTGTVAEYRLEFARRAARVKDWPESALLGAFIAGMKEEGSWEDYDLLKQQFHGFRLEDKSSF